MIIHLTSFSLLFLEKKIASKVEKCKLHRYLILYFFLTACSKSAFSEVFRKRERLERRECVGVEIKLGLAKLHNFDEPQCPHLQKQCLLMVSIS